MLRKAVLSLAVRPPPLQVSACATFAQPAGRLKQHFRMQGYYLRPQACMIHQAGSSSQQVEALLRAATAQMLRALSISHSLHHTSLDMSWHDLQEDHKLQDSLDVGVCVQASVAC